jgi:hypothetical protein
LVALNIRDLQLTLNWPWNVNGIQKPLSFLNNVLQNPDKARVLVVELPSFTQNSMQICCSILPSIAHKTKHAVKKALL